MYVLLLQSANRSYMTEESTTTVSTHGRRGNESYLGMYSVGLLSQLTDSY
jgi:hypothetical protein